MRSYLIIGIKISLVTIVLFGVLYPLMITGSARIIAHHGGNGDEVKVNGRVVGFELIGQRFDDDKYFNSRPSAVNYDASATGGSNKGPSNPDYLAIVQARIDTFLVHNPHVQRSQIPVDLVTASGAGLDPHISPAAARVQIDRIATMRNLDKSKLESLINDHIEKPFLGILGVEKVHVLRLNISLDNMK